MQTTKAAPAATSRFIPVSQIQPSPHQARKDFDEEALRGLAESMKEQGLLDPILVRRIGEPAMGRNVESAPPSQPFELIAGERRLRAAKLLNWQTIEAKVIETAGEADAAAKGLVENLQRQDLNPIEEAQGFKLLNQLDRKRWTLENIGQIAGKDKGYISRSIGLLDLPEEIVEKLRRRNFSRDHGIELSRLSNKADQLRVARQIPGKLTREETRALVDQMLGQKPQAQPKKKSLASVDWDASKGFQFTAHDQWVDVRGTWDRNKDVDTFLAELRGALLIWISQHEYQVKGKDLPPDLRAAMTRRPESVYHNPQDKRSLAEKLKQAVQMFKGKPKVRLPANPQEQAELEALAAQGPQAVYTWIYGPDSFFATSMAGATWEKLGYSTPVEGLRDVVKGIRG